MGYEVWQELSNLQGPLEKSPNAWCDVRLVADAVKDPGPILAGSEPEVLRIRCARIVLRSTPVEAVVRGENDQGLTLYAPGSQIAGKPPELLIVGHKGLGIVCAVLTRFVTQRVRFLVVNPREATTFWSLTRSFQ